MTPSHPFYPPLVPIPTYVPPAHSVFQVFLTVSIVAGLTNLLIQRAISNTPGPTVGKVGRSKAVWFACCKVL